MRIFPLHKNQQHIDITRTTSSDHDNVVVELVGLTKCARTALTGRPLIVRCFPFRIGRLSRTDLLSTAKLDLLLPDWQPYQVSRNHLVIDRNNGAVFLIDEASTCGTCVDTMRFGAKIGAQSSVILDKGHHTLALGMADSPYLFSLVVRAVRASDHLMLDGALPDRLPQARMLYDKLCSMERDLLTDASLMPAQRSTTAGSMARAMVDKPDLLDLLQCLAGSPVCRGEFLSQHSVNTAIHSMTLFGRLNYALDDVVKLTAAAFLHDIGMMGVNRDVLLKNGALKPEDFAAVKLHTRFASGLLRGTDDIGEIALQLARDHHERIDRSGYPRGVDLLPDYTRYMGLLDSFEAMTHDRPQREAFTPHEAVRMLANSPRPSFDSDTRKAFLNVFSFFPVFSIVRLSTGETAQVVRATQDCPMAPRVRVLLDRTGQQVPAERIVDLSREPGVSIIKDVNDRGLARSCAKVLDSVSALTP